MDKTDQTQKLEDLLRNEFLVPVETSTLLPSLRSEGVSVAQRSAVYGLSIAKAKSVNLISSESIQASAPTMSWADEKKYLQDLATKAILGVAALLFVAFILLTGMMKLADIYDLESKVKSIDLVVRGISILIGAAIFFVFYKSSTINNFMNEIDVDLLTKVS